MIECRRLQSFLSKGTPLGLDTNVTGTGNVSSRAPAAAAANDRVGTAASSPPWHVPAVIDVSDCTLSWHGAPSDRGKGAGMHVGTIGVGRAKTVADVST